MRSARPGAADVQATLRKTSADIVWWPENPAGCAACPLLWLTSSDYESENCRKERLPLGRPSQRCPPCSDLVGGYLASLHGSVNRARVELLVDGEPGRSGKADGVRDYSYGPCGRAR